MLHKVSKHDRPRRRVEAEENAVLDVQFAILDILREEGIAKEELASRLGVTKARISQLFATGANPTLKQLARIFDALDRVTKITSVPYADYADYADEGFHVQFDWRETRHKLKRFYGAANENYYCEEKREAA
jgi:transcriptional regulator with XRE-family HTH domain